VLILGSIVAIGPMSIDMYLPALPALQQHFGADEASTQLTLALFFVGLALGQLFYGPISDRYGRKAPLLVGLGLYVLASLGCVFAPSVEALTGLRFLQAVGGASGMVITRAMVRDRFEPQEMARVISSLILVMGVAPILAPTAGGYVFQHFGWQAIFVVLTAFGALCFAVAARGLDETLAAPITNQNTAMVIRGYGHLLRHRRFMGYALAGGVAQGGMFAYIAASAFVFIQTYGVSPAAYGWLFGINAFGLIAASQINGQLLKRHASQRIMKAALAIYAGSGALMLAAALSGIGGLPGIVVPLFICVSSLGCTFPNSTAGAMAPFGDRAGSASALLGTLQFTIAAVLGGIVGRLPGDGAVPMATAIAGCGIGSVLLLKVLVGPPPASSSAPQAP
jgi:DHA1 family bicyclomycin/chloramphenicol resistance-like MFS transporter